MSAARSDREALRIGDRVSIRNGPHAGESGEIRQKRHFPTASTFAHSSPLVQANRPAAVNP